MCNLLAFYSCSEPANEYELNNECHRSVRKMLPISKEKKSLHSATFLLKCIFWRTACTALRSICRFFTADNCRLHLHFLLYERSSIQTCANKIYSMFLTVMMSIFFGISADNGKCLVHTELIAFLTDTSSMLQFYSHFLIRNILETKRQMCSEIRAETLRH